MTDNNGIMTENKSEKKFWSVRVMKVKIKHSILDCGCSCRNQWKNAAE